ncbi:hypothetical protein LTR66_015291, partial [Elasticomyces elasticus]
LETKHEEDGKAALNERWKRRQFYLDEESGLKKPDGFPNSNIEADETSKSKSPSIKPSLSRRPSLRSRSSSKVRFDDSAFLADDDMDVKSIGSKYDISSRNTPHNERWGGLELKHVPADVGQDLIYEAVEQAFNDLLDHFFKDIEDKAVQVLVSRDERQEYKAKHKITASKDGTDTVESAEAFVQKITDELSALGHKSETEETTTGNIAGKDDLLSFVDEWRAGGHSPAEDYLSDIQTGDDPTMPQNKPNAEVSVTQSIEMNDKRSSDRLSAKWLALAERKSKLTMWLEHEKLEEQARERGSFGRLNYKELMRKMREDLELDKKEDEAGGDQEFWAAKADLGRFSFLSSWLEMGSF